MKIRILLIIATVFILSSNSIFSQIYFIPIPLDRIPSNYEHGFLPGAKFPFFNTIDKYEFHDLKVRVELIDGRFDLNLKHINCSDINISNTSEYKDPKAVYKVIEYVEKIFSESGILIDSTATDRLTINLEALDARLIGFGYIRVHGLSQMKFKFNDFEQTYCIDLMDGDKHSPLKKSDFVTRRTATRVMLSASIRENIEHFLIDLKTIEKQ